MAHACGQQSRLALWIIAEVRTGHSAVCSLQSRYLAAGEHRTCPAAGSANLGKDGGLAVLPLLRSQGPRCNIEAAVKEVFAGYVMETALSQAVCTVENQGVVRRLKCQRAADAST